MNDSLIAKILAKGMKVEDTNFRGYTRSQLEMIGIDKPTLKKAVKLGLIKETSVREKSGQVRTFFYIEEAQEDTKVAENPTP